jgi:hypothetical protein
MYTPPTKSYEDLKTELTAIDYKIKNSEVSAENFKLLLEKRRQLIAGIAKMKSDG